MRLSDWKIEYLEKLRDWSLLWAAMYVFKWPFQTPRTRDARGIYHHGFRRFYERAETLLISSMLQNIDAISRSYGRHKVYSTLRYFL